MKPDGVATAALEPMETLESNPENEAVPDGGQDPNQAASPVGEGMPQHPVGETGQATAKTKPTTTSPSKTTSGSRSNTSQNRLSNGVSKPQTNGVTKKSTPATDKKSTTTSASSKKPTGAANTLASKSKMGEKKATGAVPATNGAKSTTGSTAAKKTPSTTANGVKTSTTAAAAKKPPGHTTESFKVEFWSRVVCEMLWSSFIIELYNISNALCFHLDVTKSSTPAAKKSADSPLTRPSSTTKSAKPETPKAASKSDATTKKLATSKAADAKTPSRSKTQDSKPTPSKDVSKTPASKAAAAKTSSPKKAVGSSTPTPVKRGPKTVTGAEPEKEIAAAVSAAAAIATAAAAIVGPGEPEPSTEVAGERAAPEAVQEKISESISAPVSEPETTPELVCEPIESTPEAIAEPIPEPVREPTPEPKYEPTAESIHDPTPEPLREPTPEPMREPTPEPVREPTPELVREATPEPVRELTPEPAREPTPELVWKATPEPMRELTPEPAREPTPELVREATPEPVRELTPEPAQEPTPELVREATPEPVRELTPEPVREPTPELVREATPEPMREPTPEPMREPTHELVQEPSPDQVQVTFPEHLVESLSQPSTEPELEAESGHEPASYGQLSAQREPFKFEESANDSVTSLGTTVMSPPCSPPGSVSPVREPQDASSLLDMNIQPDPWNGSQYVDSYKSAVNMMNLQTEEEKENKEHLQAQETREEEEEEEERGNFLMPNSEPRSAEACNTMAQPHSPIDDFTSSDLISPLEKEEAVEKADEEINEDDDEEEEEEEEEEDEEQRRLGHQPSSIITDMSMSQPSDEFQVRSSVFGSSAGWQGDDLLSGMDSEDVTILEEDERVDDMDLSSERVEEHHKVFQQHEHDEEDDEDVEMHSEGVTESFGNVDEDDFNEEERSDNLNRSVPPPCMPQASSWGQANPFSDTWGQQASLLTVSSPSPLSDHGAAESETPTLSPAQACLDSSAPCFAPQSEQEPQHELAYEEMKDSATEDAHILLAAPAVGMSQSSTLSGTGLAAHSSSETSTPEELRDYDSSSGVESRSDKQQTPVPASVQPDMDQDLGIHLEKGDGEEEEAETLPADEVLGTGPPTAPASAPSSPSTSGDEASDTEGEMQINDPDTPMMMDESAGFESPTPTSNLPALEEDEEAVDTPAGEGEEDGGGATPQSANSVASYGFDCTTSNSNAHSMAESCGKSPGIFSLENEEQLPEEAKDPSLIKELTLSSGAATAQTENLLGRPVDLMPLGLPGDIQPSLDEQHYMLGGKVAEGHLGEVDTLEHSHHLGAEESGDTGESQPPYYSTICDKTDSFLAGNVDRDCALQTHLQEDNQNQNHTSTNRVANGHYLAMVPGNRRPIDPTLAAHFAKIAPPPALETDTDGRVGGEQLRRLEQHQQKLREMQHRQEQEKQKRQWLEEERLRLEQQKQLEKQRRELLQLQLQQQQQEHRQRRQVLQWQLELEQQYRMQQKHIQQQQQLRRSPTGVMISPSSGLCTIYEAMETSDEEDEARGQNRNRQGGGRRVTSPHGGTQGFYRHLRPMPPQDLEWNKKVDMVQQLINQTLMLSGDDSCPPLLLLPVGTGGTLSPLESSMWPSMLPQFSPPAATVTSVSSYSPDSQGSSTPGDWTVVEVETQH
uniref:BTB/POZ domain-containing protein n=1 Tax=Echeneis naucrates TaxID=173247 RepID=A0A665W4L2_ECHNA